PDPRFFRRKGEPAFQMVGIDGETFADAGAYLLYLSRHLNDGYVASRDLRLYAEALRQVVAGTLTVEQGVKAMPKLKRLGGTCPCSRSVRWVMEESNGTETTGMTRPACRPAWRSGPQRSRPITREGLTAAHQPRAGVS